MTGLAKHDGITDIVSSIPSFVVNFQAFRSDTSAHNPLLQNHLDFRL